MGPSDSDTDVLDVKGPWCKDVVVLFQWCTNEALGGNAFGHGRWPGHKLWPCITGSSGRRATSPLYTVNLSLEFSLLLGLLQSKVPPQCLQLMFLLQDFSFPLHFSKPSLVSILKELS